MNLADLKKIFEAQCPNAFAWHHYDLAKNTTVRDPAIWKKFLQTPEIAEWINNELNILQGAELNKLLQDINNSQSTGKAQIIAALSRLRDDRAAESAQNGPTYIYCYIPLNAQQEQADNVNKLTKDPFQKEK